MFKFSFILFLFFSAGVLTASFELSPKVNGYSAAKQELREEQIEKVFAEEQKALQVYDRIYKIPEVDLGPPSNDEHLQTIDIETVFERYNQVYALITKDLPFDFATNCNLTDIYFDNNPESGRVSDCLCKSFLKAFHHLMAAIYIRGPPKDSSNVKIPLYILNGQIMPLTSETDVGGQLFFTDNFAKSWTSLLELERLLMSPDEYIKTLPQLCEAIELAKADFIRSEKALTVYNRIYHQITAGLTHEDTTRLSHSFSFTFEKRYCIFLKYWERLPKLKRFHAIILQMYMHGPMISGQVQVPCYMFNGAFMPLDEQVVERGIVEFIGPLECVMERMEEFEAVFDAPDSLKTIKEIEEYLNLQGN